MPGTDDLRDFLEERLTSYDPDVDLSDGSPINVEVIDPIVERFTPDPFEMDIPTYIRTRLQQEYPNLSIEEGDALSDALVKPMEALLDPIIREVTFLRNNKSIANPELLAPAEADSLMANIFLSRQRGDYAQGRVRLFFAAPTSVTIGVSNAATTAGGLSFYPLYPQTISAESMLFNQSGNLYYFDVTFKAESPGDEYNVAAGEIISVTNVPGVVRVRNLYTFRGGSPEEDTTEYVSRGELSIIERSLVVARGARARLFDQFADLQHLQVVGFGDAEMDRDIITGGALGEVVLYGTDGAVADDGDGDGVSGTMQTGAGGLLANVGQAGAVDSFYMTAKGRDFPVTHIVSDTEFKFSADADGNLLPDSLTAVEFYIRKKELTLSDIPGGIVYPNGPNGEIIIEPDAIHVGGAMDLHVAGTTLEETSMTIETITDQDPVVSGEDLQTVLVGGTADVVYSPSVDFLALGVKVGMTLVVETGSDAASYSVLRASPGGLGGNYLQVSPNLTTTATGIKFKVVDEIDMDLNEPKTLRGSGTDLKTVIGSAQVSTVSGVDFSSLGVQANDTLRISGDDEDAKDHVIQQVTGTGNTILILGEALKKTSSSREWAIYHVQDGIELPVVRISGVELLDSTLQATGEIIPYADPVDIRSAQFSNVGIGEKLSITDARIGILGTVDLSGSVAAVNGKTLRLSINGGATVTVTFSGVATAQDIVTQINASTGTYKVAGLVTVDAEQRLTIRSISNWVKVLSTGSANTTLGFSASYDEDNRQITSASVTSWLANDVVAQKDAVHITTGDAAGFWYIQEADSDRLFIINVEDGKAVFPLPGESASLVVGSRSFGTVRLYFLDPTSISVQGNYRGAALTPAQHAGNTVLGSFSEPETERTEFSFDVFGDGSSIYKFYPDPALEHQLLPATDEDVPNNLTITSPSVIAISEASPTSGPGQYSRDAAIDFLTREAVPGDILEITYAPLQGTVDIRPSPTGAITYPTDLTGKTLVFSIENGADRTVVFTSDVTDENALVDAINEQLGEDIAFIEDTGTVRYLRLEADFAFTLRSSSTALTTDVFGLAASAGSNAAPAAGKYVISSVGYISGSTSDHSRITIESKVGDPAWTAFTAGQAGPSQHFKLHRPGMQRVSSTDMESNVEGTLYYADIELLSEGPGDAFNIAEDQVLTVAGHQSDGFLVTNGDDKLSFSTAEELQIRFSRRYLPVGSTDAPANMVTLSKQNVQVNYTRSDLVDEVQAFATSDLDRVLTANILARHLIPHYVQFVANYEGGSSENIVLGDLEDYINETLPEDPLEASAIIALIKQRGATRIESPITLIGVVHNEDRTVTVERSDDAITSGRLSTFIPGDIELTRDSV